MMLYRLACMRLVQLIDAMANV